MLSSELYYKVNSIDDTKIVSINGYKYYRVNVSIPGPIDLLIYVSSKYYENLKVDNYYYCKKAYLTSSYEDNPREGSFSFRIDSGINSSEEQFKERNDITIVRFNARVGKRSGNILKYFGAMRIPTYSVRASIKNEFGKLFHILVVGYHSKAKALDALAPVTYIDVVGQVSPPKKAGKACAIILKEHTLRKEV